MTKEFIKSWMGKSVRIKDEYIVDGWVVPELSYFNGIEHKTFKVQMDCYGVDLFAFRNDEMAIESLPCASHLIILEDYGHPFLWKSKYFETL
jgi:hypothetical protein